MTDSETETLPREVDKRKQALFTDLGSGFWSDETQKHKPSVKNHSLFTKFISSTLCFINVYNYSSVHVLSIFYIPLLLLSLPL